jgi:NAD(P)-dependent dehydrogenase (short-subunit alcohol dehydrogenase family)
MPARVAVITGATRGIGRALARRLASRGVRIAAVYLSDAAAASLLDAELTSAGVESMIVRCDVCDFVNLRKFGREVVSRFGRVDYLVNNVGVDIFKSVDAVSLDEWRRAQDVILNAPFVLTKELLPSMRQAHFGRVVMLGASSRDYEKGAPGLGPFGVHKAALKVLMRTLALEEIQHGITVNMVAPGSTAEAGVLPEQERIPVSRIPLGRRVALSEVADAIDYFLADSAAAVTGQVLAVNGGMST